jgi:MFS family permease
VASFLIDLTPIRQLPDYRRLWFGQAVSFIGTQLTAVAVPVEVYRKTHSSLLVGLVGIAQLVPLLAGSLISGAVVDAVDRRRVLRVTSLVLACCSVGLALDAVGGSTLLALYGITAVAAGVSSLDWPARSAATPMLVPPELRPSANALQQVQMQVGAVAGPAMAGLLIARFGVPTVFAIDAVSFSAVFIAAVRIRPLPPAGGGTKIGFASVAEGLRFLKGARLIVATFVIDINAMVFGMPRALFPELADKVYGGGATTAGLLYAAPGAGALLAALVSGWVGRVRRQGRAILYAVALWGVGIALAGATRWLWVALAALALAGAADVVSAVFRSTITQTEVPDSLRGRLAAVFIAVVTGGPRLGDAEAGAAAAVLGAQGSVLSGGLACVAGVGLIAWRWPELARYERPDDLGGGGAEPGIVVVEGEGGPTPAPA